jgi:hypothetical protein
MPDSRILIITHGRIVAPEAGLMPEWKTGRLLLIEPGMTSKQLADKMGEPLKKVTFGHNTLWTYKGLPSRLRKR